MAELIKADNRHVLYGVRLIIEKQLINNAWESHRWVIHDLVPLNLSAGNGYPPSNDIRFEPLRQAGSGEIKDALFTAEASLDLHRAEAEAYADNLASAEPSIYAVLRKNEDDGYDIDKNLILDNNHSFKLVSKNSHPNFFLVSALFNPVKAP